ncbi:MAG TPA: hypothetical protein VNH65_22235 [Candidatus Acidoferrum sp.]|nr:hypothetical protein [Candidatus Acidoferrum sp.]
MPEIGLLSFARVAYEDWTFREAEIGLREHRELRAVLRLSSAPDHTTVHRFLRRLPDATASATW